jgi:hypothetical protein
VAAEHGHRGPQFRCNDEIARTPLALDAELARPALVLALPFRPALDLYAHQLDNGHYVCVHEPLNTGHLLDHLRGEITLGAYLLDQESRARFLVLDADDDQSWVRLGHLAKALAREDVPAYLEASRRGGHLWLFLAQAMDGREVRTFGQGLLAAHQIEGVELYPKQDQLADGPGSLIRIPFGVHRLTGRRYGFYNADRSPLAPTIRERIYALKVPETVPEAAFEACHLSGKILLLDLGRSDGETNRLIGSLMVTGLELAMRRRRNRKLWNLTIDEFAGYVANERLVKTLAHVFSEGRKFRMSMTVAHQDLSQLTPRMLGALSNAQTKVIFGNTYILSRLSAVS